MREIKFRAWDINRKKMYYLDMGLDKLNLSLNYNDISGWNIEKCPIAPHDEWLCGESSDNPMELMQYTGLKDKNGKEIFEGDLLIVGAECNPYIIKYGLYIEHSQHKHDIERSHLGYYIEESNGKQTSLTYKMSFVAENFAIEFKPEWCEIIGNIYEHPDLLPVKP